MEPLVLRSRTLNWNRTYIVAIVNVTPDSFSDGGQFRTTAHAVDHARRAVAAGADVLDVGGESTRPGAQPVSESEELRRVIPVIEALAKDNTVPVSVDTTKASVAQAAIRAGAEIVNDISGGRFDGAMGSVVDEVKAAYVCGHCRATSIAGIHEAQNEPATFDEVVYDLQERAAALPDGLRARTIFDPGLGFGKLGEQNVALLARAPELIERLQRPVMMGPSRKRFIAELAGDDMLVRDGGTVGAAISSVQAGVHFVRVHNVPLVRSAIAVYSAIRGGARSTR